MQITYNINNLSPLLPYPKKNAHKYSRGVVNVLAGSSNFPGAACMCANAAQKIGAGYVRVYTHDSAIPIVQTFKPSLVVSGYKDAALVIESARDSKYPLCNVAGPGLEPDCDVVASAILAMLNSQHPLVLDAGAFAYLENEALRKRLVRRAKLGYLTILTPHAGEAYKIARLLGLVATENPRELSLSISEIFGCVVVLKSHETWVTSAKMPENASARKSATKGEAFEYLMKEGTPALAKAGTGDILTGIIAGLLAQNLEGEQACVLATWLHAKAAKISAEKLTEICVCPEDVLDAIAQAVKSLE